MVALSAMFMVSCGGAEKNEETTHDENHEGVVEEVKINGIYTINDGSIVNWDAKHYKDTSYVHHGTINIANGKINVTDNEISGGEFTFDMGSIVEPGTDTTQPWTLQGHFKTPDFFNIAEFSTSNFAVKSATENHITGDLTIIGITKEISFPAEVTIADDKIAAVADFNLDMLQFELPHLVQGDSLPEEEKMESANPSAHIHFELSANKE